MMPNTADSMLIKHKACMVHNVVDVFCPIHCPRFCNHCDQVILDGAGILVTLSTWFWDT